MTGRIRLAATLMFVSVLLILPGVLSGYLNDDYFFASVLLEGTSPFGYYDFLSPDTSSIVPWWTAEGFQVRFLRPLASLTLHLDFTLFGGMPLVAHIHSLLWFLVLLAGGFALLGRLLTGKKLTWAMVILALGVFHTLPGIWISARHAVMGGAFVVWSALLYLRWRQGGRPWEGLGAFALFLLGLLSSEAGLGAVSFVVTYELLLAQDGWKRRLLAATPTIVAALTYVVAYKLLAYGPSQSGAYVDPFSETGQYLTDAVPKVLSLIGVFTLGVPAMLRMLPGFEMIPVIAGGIGLGLLLLGLWLGRTSIAAEEMKLVAWLALAALLATAPALSGLVEGRGVLLSGICFAGVAGVIVASLFGREGPLLRRLPALAVALILCLGFCVTSPLSRLGAGMFMYQGSQIQAALAEDSAVDCRRGARVYVVNADPFSAVSSPYVMAKGRGRFFDSWNQLCLANGDVTLTRTAADQIRISRDASLFESSIRLYREDFTGLTAGTVVERPDLVAEIHAGSPAGPTEIDFTIPGLGDPNEVCLLTFDDGLLEHVQLPEVGSSTVVSFTPPEM